LSKTIRVAIFAVSVLLAGICIAAALHQIPEEPSVQEPSVQMTIPEAKTPLASSVAAKGVLKPALKNVVTKGDISVDISHLAKGFIFVRYTGDLEYVQLRFEGGTQGSKGDSAKAPVHPYYCPAKSDWQGYPLPYGSGDYVLYAAPFNKEDIGVGKRWGFTFAFTAQFAEEEPFRYQSFSTPYSNTSTAALQARALVDAAELERARKLTSREIADLINTYICENIEFDTDFATKVNKEGSLPYFPDPEQTLLTQQGICVDIATLSAAMLKSLGVPVRLHFGDVVQSALDPQYNGETTTKYHAWISVYLDSKWVMYDPSNNPPIIENNRIANGAQPTEYLVETASIR
jgi:hypothetical protein